MEDNNTGQVKAGEQKNWDELRQELKGLDENYVDIDGLNVKPSQCYRITGNSLQVLYNTNCPDTLKEKINSILSKYAGEDENYPPEEEFYFP